MDFTGYTREWDLTDKSQSFCKGNDTYEQVITKVLSEYQKAQIRDEASQGAKIPGLLMQYEETDWTFLKRLASHFFTFVLADNTTEYGKAYFGIPHMDHGTVLKEEEYTLLKGKESYEKLPDTGDIMPQEMMRWRLRSRRHMQLGEQVMLGHIETVVTAVDIRTEQEDLIFEYELSRRKGILTGIANSIDDTIIDREETYGYNKKNELTQRRSLSAVTEYLYDENESLVREKEGSKTASYQYDLLNRQTHVRTFEGRE